MFSFGFLKKFSFARAKVKGSEVLQQLSFKLNGGWMTKVRSKIDKIKKEKKFGQVKKKSLK